MYVRSSIFSLQSQCVVRRLYYFYVNLFSLSGVWSSFAQPLDMRIDYNHSTGKIHSVVLPSNASVPLLLLVTRMDALTLQHEAAAGLDSTLSGANLWGC